MINSTKSLADHESVGWQFDNTYSRLPDILFTPAKPAAMRAPRISILNHRLADELGLDLGVMSPEAANRAGIVAPSDKHHTLRARRAQEGQAFLAILALANVGTTRRSGPVTRTG